MLLLSSLSFAPFCSILLRRVGSSAADEPIYDLVVYGGTAGGVAAACRPGGWARRPCSSSRASTWAA